MKKFTLALVASFTFTFAAKAQDGFENLLLASQGDSEKLLQAYFSPLFEGFTSGMNNGWYHTAKVHKLFDLMFLLLPTLLLFHQKKKHLTLTLWV